MSEWVYKETEPGVWTVGFYAPAGAWYADSDWDNRDDAREWVHYLNGGEPVGTVENSKPRDETLGVPY